MEDVYYCTRIVGTCMLLLSNLDIESKREEYKGFGGNGDDDDNDQGDGDRQKSLHQIGHVPHKETNVTGHGGPATSNKSEAGGSLQDVQPPLLPLEPNSLLLPLEANSLQDVLVHNIISAPVGQRKR